MFDRYKAVQNLAYNIRKEEGLKTRVKIGLNDPPTPQSGMLGASQLTYQLLI